MRIIAGELRGRSLFYPQDRAFRPTQDRPKEALFSILHPRLEGAKVADLFCGTGSLGLEALSRGAESCVFVDIETTFLRKNIALFESMKPKAEVVSKPVQLWIKQKQGPFDIVMIDPPWHKEDRGKHHYDTALLGLDEFDILADSGILVCEHHKSLVLEETEHFEVTQTRAYSDTRLTFFQKKVTL